MKIRAAVTLVEFAVSFALPTFAQQTNIPNPQLRQRLLAVIEKHADAMNKNDAAAAAALFHGGRDLSDGQRTNQRSGGY
jgi:hypothetical protein